MASMKEDPTFVSVSEHHRGDVVVQDAEKELNEPGISAAIPEKYRGTDHDKREMSMLGKKQVLRRNFKFVTMLGTAESRTLSFKPSNLLGFASTVMASWEILLP